MVTASVSVANLPNAGLVAGTFVGTLTFQSADSAVTVPVCVVVGTNVLTQVNAISFTKVFGGPNPLPQTLTIAGIGRSVGNFVRSYTASGGNWLSTGGCTSYCGTPNTITAIVNANVTLAVGTYTGEIVITSQDGGMTITVAVTLTIAPSNGTYFDSVPGQMSFSFQTGALNNPPAQTIQIRNGGSGTLDWSLSVSTSDSGNWLSASTLSGGSFSTVSVSIQKQNLPGGGLIAGTFIGNLVFQGSGSSVTVPVSVVAC